MTRRYPLEPLLVLARVSVSKVVTKAHAGGREYRQWQDVGLSPQTADRLAGLFGYLACEVWPSWFDDALEDLGRDCDDCGGRFLPARRDGRFCDPVCYRRWWGRETARRRRLRPELAERNRQRRRAYYAENGAYERARERRRYEQRRASSDLHAVDGSVAA